MDEQTPQQDVEAWADGFLARHRGPAPAPRRERPWYLTELPRVGAVLRALAVIGLILFAVAGVMLVEITFNSG